MKRTLRRSILLILGGLTAVVVGSGLVQWWNDRSRSAQGGPRSERTEGLEIPRRPRSVLLLTLDTTRADRLQPYGARDVSTPTFARLAREGMTFRRAYSVSPITLVAHTSILTGLYPPQHGVRNNGTHYVPEELETLAEILRGEDYRTAAFVSAAVLEKRYGLNQGFELYDDDLSSGRARHPRMVPDRPAEATVDEALTWLESLEEDERFFAWVHFYDPHAAYSPPPPFRDQYRERLYDGEIAYMDSEIGRLLAHPRLGADQELVVLAVGDHGESLGEHGEDTHAILAYDSTLHVPWILRVDGGPAGVGVKLPVSHVDVLPTMLDLLGLESVGRADGPLAWSGASVFGRPRGTANRFSSGGAGGLYSETYLPYYTYGWAKLKVLRRGDWKYIDAPTPELYDLRRDPHELTNLYPHREGVAHDLTRDLSEFLDRLGDPERETTLELDTEAADRLRSLGYLAQSADPGSEPEAGRDRPDPKDVIDLHVGLERARSLIRDRLFSQAVRQLRGVLDRDPQNLAALIELASAFDLDGRPDEAQEVAERALGLDPNNPRLHLQLAALEARDGRRDQALQLIDAALEIEPRYLEGHLQKALLLQQMRRFDEAEAVLSAALEDHPDHPRLNAVYARSVELRSGAVEAAEKRVRQALERDPFLVFGYRTLGEILVAGGRFDEALATYRAGLERAPDDGELHGRLGLMLAERGAGAEAERHLSEAIRLIGAQGRQFRADLHVARGGWLAEQGRLDEAQREYERVLAVEPGHPDARNNRAIAFYRTGRAEEAIRELEAVVADFPRHADSHNNLAAIAVEQQDWPAAERHARRALDLDPGLAQGWNNLGVGLDEQGQAGAAETAYREALKIDGRYWPARFNLAVLLRKSERFAEAVAELEEVLAAVPSHPEVHFELGELFAGPLADASRARGHFNAVVRAAPGHPRAAAARQRLSEI